MFHVNRERLWHPFLMRVVAAALVLITFSSQTEPTVPAAILKHIEQELASARIPGASIAIVSGNETVTSGYGIADTRSKDLVTPDTLMHIGSLTKLFTALAVTATLHARELPLETPVGKVKPGLSARAAAATFHELLSHTSGLRDRQGDAGSDDELALASSSRELTDADFLFPGGLVFSYSNPGYALAGAALESMIKKGFAEALRDAVLAPLAMERSTMRPSEALSRAHAVGHRSNGESPAAIPEPANDTRIWPAGYLWTNAADMGRALNVLINQGQVDGRQALPRAVIDKVTSPHAPMPNVFVGGHYGYGLMIARDRDVLIYEHGGTLPGFSAILRIAPERRLGIAIMTNLDNAPLRRVAQVVMGRALNLPEAKLTPRQDVAVSVAEMKPLLGRYENRGSAELAVRGEDVVLILDDGPPLVVTRVGENRYVGYPKPGAPGPEFVVEPGTQETPGYLHFALWAYRRR